MLARNYNPILIILLKRDHKRLFEIYGNIKNIFENGESYDKVINKLDELKAVLSMHIEFENSQLYSYLESIYKEDKIKLAFLYKADREMGDIVNIALKFIDKFSKLEILIKDREQFKKGLEEIGEVLVKRVEFEENRLYPLYS